MSAASSIALVAWREIVTRLRSKAVIISTIILVLLIVGGLQAAAYFTSAKQETPVVGLTHTTSVLKTALRAAATAQGTTLQVTAVPDRAEAQLEDGRIGMLVDGEPSRPTLSFYGAPDPALVSLASAAVREYALREAIVAAGGDPAVVEGRMAEVGVTVVDTNPTTAGREIDLGRVLVAMATISLLLFGLIQSGSLIAVGVVEEKSSRVVEILLAAIRPTQLLGGKVIGVGAVALGQVVVFTVAGLASAKAGGMLTGVDFNVGASVAWMGVWFLLGFALYAALFGGLSSLVSRQEDIGVITTPMMFGMMIPFYLGIYLVPNQPDALVTKVLSLIPFFAPFMMPVRIGLGAVSVWEIVASVAICLVTIPATIWLGGRVYSRAVLNTGGRMKLSAALRG